MIVLGLLSIFVLAITLSQISPTDRIGTPPVEATDGLKVSENWLWPTWSGEKENDGSVAKPRTVVLSEPQRRSSNDCTAGRS